MQNQLDQSRTEHCSGENLDPLDQLEVLNLYRTKITNAGLDRLKRMTRLREVDLRYTRTTSAGVAAKS